MRGFTEPEDGSKLSDKDRNDARETADTRAKSEAGAVKDGSMAERSWAGAAAVDVLSSGSALEKMELDAALQLLVERAQYITGATGTALALPQGEEMVCRASAGSSAPAVGARLQVRSGLTGESLSRKQLLRCDNAEADPRVNLEACRALGIASIVVLPLLRRDGEVRGLFELFSDHPYAFEERDLIALERMAELTGAALDLSERQRPADAAAGQREPETPNARLSAAAAASGAVRADPGVVATPQPSGSSEALAAAPPLTSPSALSSSSSPATVPLSREPVPESMLRVQKCASCGFPVSEGRTLCLDCEKKEREKNEAEKLNDGARPDLKAQEPSPDTLSGSDAASSTAQEEFVPAFLVNSASEKHSWLAEHINLLAILVLILGILVAVVVFR